MKNLQKQDKLVGKTWDNKWEIDIKFGVFKFKEIRERLKSFTLRNIALLLQPLENNRENV